VEGEEHDKTVHNTAGGDSTTEERKEGKEEKNRKRRKKKEKDNTHYTLPHSKTLHSHHTRQSTDRPSKKSAQRVRREE
jgi:hypothetical protein